MEKINRKVRIEEDQSTAKLFASTSNLYTGYELSQKHDSRAQKQNVQIIRQILEMFSLEECMEKYETQNVLEYVLDSSDFGYDCSLSTTRVRQRLCDLMGTDVIRLNDKRYFQKLSEKLQDEYDTAMDKHEDSRAASEEQRLRRLMLEGIIESPNDYRSIIHGEHKKQTKKMKKRRSKKLGSQEGTSIVVSTASDDELEKKPDVVSQVERMSNASRPSSTQPRSSQATPQPHRPASRQDDKVEMHARPPHHENALRSSSSCSTHRKSRRVKSASVKRTSWGKETDSDETDGEPSEDKRYDTQSLPDRSRMRTPSKYSKQEPEVIKQLRTEQTVAGLYALAEELVSPVSAADDSHRGKVHA